MKAECKAIRGELGTREKPTWVGVMVLTGADGVKLPTLKAESERLNPLDALRDAAKLLDNEIATN